MLMTSVTKRILSWPSISRFYVGTAILTLILWIASFQQVNEIFADTNNLYQHPYKVSNASLTIKLHIQRINQIIKGSKYAQNKEQIKTALSLVSEHENEILGKLSLISQRYLGKQGVIDNIYQLVDDWKLIRQDFFYLYLQKINSKYLKRHKRSKTP
jgi:hypothetical protein